MCVDLLIVFLRYTYSVLFLLQLLPHAGVWYK